MIQPRDINTSEIRQLSVLSLLPVCEKIYRDKHWIALCNIVTRFQSWQKITWPGQHACVSVKLMLLLMLHRVWLSLKEKYWNCFESECNPRFTHSLFNSVVNHSSTFQHVYVHLPVIEFLDFALGTWVSLNHWTCLHVNNDTIMILSFYMNLINPSGCSGCSVNQCQMYSYSSSDTRR